LFYWWSFLRDKKKSPLTFFNSNTPQNNKIANKEVEESKTKTNKKEEEKEEEEDENSNDDDQEDDNEEDDDNEDEDEDEDDEEGDNEEMSNSANDDDNETSNENNENTNDAEDEEAENQKKLIDSSKQFANLIKNTSNTFTPFGTSGINQSIPFNFKQTTTTATTTLTSFSIKSTTDNNNDNTPKQTTTTTTTTPQNSLLDQKPLFSFGAKPETKDSNESTSKPVASSLLFNQPFNFKASPATTTNENKEETTTKKSDLFLFGNKTSTDTVDSKATFNTNKPFTGFGNNNISTAPFSLPSQSTSLFGNQTAAPPKSNFFQTNLTSTGGGMSLFGSSNINSGSIFGANAGGNTIGMFGSSGGVASNNGEPEEGNFINISNFAHLFNDFFYFKIEPYEPPKAEGSSVKEEGSVYTKR
jgi:hypothetical protein